MRQSRCFRRSRRWRLHKPPCRVLRSQTPPPSTRRSSFMAEVVIVENRTVAGELVAEEIVRLIDTIAEPVLGLATGSTPLPVYEALRERLKGHDVSHLRGFALDEYVGIDPAHPESYRSVISREVIEPLGLDPDLI